LSGVQPHLCLPVDLADDIDGESRLLRSAAPVLEEIGDEIAGTGLIVLLADREGRVVRRVLDNSQVERRIDDFGIAMGARFSEDAVGTSSLGTPLEVRHGVAVNGAEHYLERLRGLSCYGAPIIHPATGRVEGALDMTVEADTVDPLFTPFVDRAVRDIERRLLDGSKVSQQRLVAAFQDVAPHSRAAVAAVGVDMLLHNAAAANLLSSNDYVVLREIAAELRPGGHRVIDIELACGEPARVEAQSICGSEGGAVFVVRPVLPSASPVPRGVLVGAAAARLAAEITEIAEIARSRGAVAVCGEAGSGRSTAAREIAGTRPTVWLDASHVAVEGRAQWLRRLTNVSDDTSTAVVVEHVESLPEPILPVVTRFVDGHLGPRIILTSRPVADLPPAVAAVVARCPSRLDIPPLRRRGLEFGAIARKILSGLEGSWQLTPDALATLSAADWPGNLSELACVLQTASQKAGRGRIELGDLPARYQTTGRVAHLAGRERAERQAIIEALALAAGNKVHAARELGVSRSTLYSRIKALGIRA
jgi:transcriptional regulator of acetoin/glycerol metabolism